MVAVWALLALPTALLAQAPREGGGGGEVVPPPIEWNFERVAAPAASAEMELRDRWAAPFAVVSEGRASPRESREVVVLEGSPLAPSQDSLDAVTSVRVEEAEDVEEAEEAEESEGSAAASAASPARDGDAAGASSGASGGAARTHRVTYGETWFGLAREYRVSSAALGAANPDVDPERLRAGTLLRIPAAGDEGARQRTHTVARGDTLFGIARRYGVTAAAVRSANDLSGDVVRLGQRLVIPQEETGDER